eukprot:7001052-Alexandrium_andersonii.AAC.1
MPLGCANTSFDHPALRACWGMPCEHWCTGIRHSACAAGDTCASGNMQNTNASGDMQARAD